MRGTVVVLVGLFGCEAEPGREPEATASVEVSGFAQVVPGAGMPAEVVPQPANNNLDVAWFEGRLYLAFRTAPSHFASPDTELYVVSSTDEQSWRFEGRFALGTDVREPQLVQVGGALRLYFAELGTSSLDFEPKGMWSALYEGPGQWSAPERVYLPGFIPWRIKEHDGGLLMFGYDGGANIYDFGGEPLRVHFLRSDDGLQWRAFAGEDPVVLEGGGSETDAVQLDDGSWVAVVRNEAGDESGFGSKVCTAPADDPMRWTCATDPRKFDSPLVLREAGRVWLIARRTLGQDGLYDLGRDELELTQRALTYQITYWQDPKRCAVWEVHPEDRSVSWVADLPSRGDTCFPEAVPREGGWTVYNYSNEVGELDPSWLEGQLDPTGVFRMDLTFR
jgi:hypothetical protein